MERSGMRGSIPKRWPRISLRCIRAAGWSGGNCVHADPRFVDSGRVIALGPFAGYGSAFDHVVNGLGDIGGMVADAFDVLGAEQVVDAERNSSRIFHRVGDEFPEQRDIKSVHFLVALPNPQSLKWITTYETVEHHGELRTDQIRHVAQPAEQRALRIFPAHGQDAL